MEKEKVKKCKNHGETMFVLGTDGYYDCKKCRVDNVSKRRRKVKQILVDELGGKCIICGYSKYNGALDFHHLKREDKEFGLAEKGSTIAIHRLRNEASKCVLLCKNCHAEVEAGITKL
jgi:hypothetical protein